MKTLARLVLGSLMLLSVAGWAHDASADSMQLMANISDAGVLTLDVLPLNAEIRLNGARLGTAKDVLSRAIAVVPGPQLIEIEAPGYLGRTVTVAAMEDWAVRVWLQLVPVRQ